ncbi:choice-of-anchor L domain-containing protein, partial [Flavobacterium sp.]|uniref:choice-of-anchor L domain-containing protein n=1 Tax=Flavobacterium sp. TaxID=239 RepID=UPI0028BE0696
MKKNYFLLLLLLIASFGGYSQAVTVNGSYTAQQLVDVLMDTPCVSTSNHTITTGTNFGSVNGVGVFQNTNPGFPMTAGVVLTSGALTAVPGPAAPTSSGGNSAWVGDTDIQSIVNAVPGFETDQSNNASKLEFDFVPLTNSMSFDFIFASEEYDGGSFECNYSDAFVFILTDLVTNVKTNLAVLPGTSTPILVTNVHPDNGQSCGGANPEYFEQYNAAGSAIVFDGQLVLMQASSPVIPGRAYHIKLAVSDLRDNSWDSAVFIGAGSFNVGQANLGDSLTLSAGTALCYGDTRVLDTGLNPAQYTFVWSQDGNVLATETGPSIVVTEPGLYAVTASNTGTSCSLTDDVLIEFYPEMIVGEPDDIIQCDNNGIPVDFDLSINDDFVDQSIYYATYYLSEQDALDELNQIGPIYSTLAPLTTVWVKVKNFENSCYVLKTFDLIINQCGANPVAPADITLCENASGSGVAIFDFSALSNDVASNQTGYTITYHHTQADADNDTGAISPDNAYLGTNGEEIWIRMEDNTDSTIDGVTSFHIYVLPLPAVTISGSITICEGTTGTVTFSGTPNAVVTY